MPKTVLSDRAMQARDVCHRLAEKKIKGTEARTALAGTSWPDLTRGLLHGASASLPENDSDLLREATSNVWFGSQLDGLVNSVLLDGFATAADPYAGVYRSVPLANYRAAQLAHFDQLPTLAPRPRGDTPVSVSAEGVVESTHLAAFGGQFVLDEQSLLDSDLGIGLQVVIELGRSSRRLQVDLVASTILANEALTADSVSVFDASTHGNLASAALGSAGLRAACTAILSRTLDGAHVGLVPRYLVVTPDLYGTAKELLRTWSTGDADLLLRCDSRLSAAGVVDPRTGDTRVGSDNDWYLFSAGTDAPGLVLASLNGKTEPTVREFQLGPGQWGRGWSVSTSLACTFSGYVGAYKSSP